MNDAVFVFRSLKGRDIAMVTNFRGRIGKNCHGSPSFSALAFRDELEEYRNADARINTKDLHQSLTRN